MNVPQQPIRLEVNAHPQVGGYELSFYWLVGDEDVNRQVELKMRFVSMENPAEFAIHLQACVDALFRVYADAVVSIHQQRAEAEKLVAKALFVAKDG